MLGVEMWPTDNNTPRPMMIAAVGLLQLDSSTPRYENGVDGCFMIYT